MEIEVGCVVLCVCDGRGAERDESNIKASAYKKQASYEFNILYARIL